jgi:hypothetical protein
MSSRGLTQERTSRTLCTISALPSPSATNTTCLAALTTGRVKVMRSGGGLGESFTGRILQMEAAAQQPL